MPEKQKFAVKAIFSILIVTDGLAFFDAACTFANNKEKDIRYRKPGIDLKIGFEVVRCYEGSKGIALGQGNSQPQTLRPFPGYQGS